jgi:hypothetical protein
MTTVSEFLEATGRPNLYGIPSWVVAYSLTKSVKPHSWYLVRLDADGDPVELVDSCRPNPASPDYLRRWMIDKGVPVADAAALVDKISDAPPPLAAWPAKE